MNGEAFSKQMSLKEKLQLNTIICDKEIIKILSDCKFGLDFEQIDNDTYIFSFRVERDVEIAKIISRKTIAINDQTTALVVASPTPFAPPSA